MAGSRRLKPTSEPPPAPRAAGVSRGRKSGCEWRVAAGSWGRHCPFSLRPSLPSRSSCLTTLKCAQNKLLSHGECRFLPRGTSGLWTGRWRSAARESPGCGRLVTGVYPEAPRGRPGTSGTVEPLGFGSPREPAERAAGAGVWREAGWRRQTHAGPRAVLSGRTGRLRTSKPLGGASKRGRRTAGPRRPQRARGPCGIAHGDRAVAPPPLAPATSSPAAPGTRSQSPPGCRRVFCSP